MSQGEPAVAGECTVAVARKRGEGHDSNEADAAVPLRDAAGQTYEKFRRIFVLALFPPNAARCAFVALRISCAEPAGQEGTAAAALASGAKP